MLSYRNIPWRPFLNFLEVLDAWGWFFFYIGTEFRETAGRVNWNKRETMRQSKIWDARGRIVERSDWLLTLLRNAHSTTPFTFHSFSSHFSNRLPSSSNISMVSLSSTQLYKETPACPVKSFNFQWQSGKQSVACLIRTFNYYWTS